MPPRRPWLRGFALAGLLLLTLLVALYLAWYAYATAELSAARAEAGRAGLITDIAKIIPPPCDDADNAALLYQQAYAILTLRGKPYAPGRDAGELDPRLEPLREIASAKAWAAADTATREQARTILFHDDFANAWRLVAQGARLQRCVFPGDLRDGPRMLQPQLILIRDLIKLSSMRARILAADGRAQDAADQLVDLLRASRQLADTPLLINHLVRYACDTIVLDILRDLMAANLLRGANLSAAETALTGHNLVAALATCMDGEACVFGEWLFRRIDAGTDPTGLTGLTGLLDVFDTGPAWRAEAYWWTYSSWLGIPIRRGDEATYLRILSTYRSNLRSSPAATGRMPSKPKLLAPFANLMTPSIELIVTMADKNERRCDAALTALCLHRGSSPVARSGISVTRQADGSWRISPDPLRTPPGAKLVTFDPWLVPAQPHP